MTSKPIIFALAAASLSFASLSFADKDDRRGSGRGELSRVEQHGPMGRDGHDSGRRNFDHRDHRDHRHGHGNHYGNRGGDKHHAARGEWNYGARGPDYRRGGYIPYEYRNRQYVVTNWRDHHLNAPPRGQQWVQVGSDYVLIAIATGIIAQLVLSR
jgi:Ni/Co efflux regulator RcnB